MAREPGTIRHAGGGGQTGYVGDLQVSDAISAVQDDRVFLRGRNPGIDVEQLLAALEVESLSELRRLVEYGKVVEAAGGLYP